MSRRIDPPDPAAGDPGSLRLATEPTPSPMPSEEPDPNRKGMPKCPRCGDIAFWPDPVSTRQERWRCGGCLRTLAYCVCPALPPDTREPVGEPVEARYAMAIVGLDEATNREWRTWPATAIGPAILNRVRPVSELVDGLREKKPDCADHYIAGYQAGTRAAGLRSLTTARSAAEKAGVTLRHTETLEQVAQRIVDDPHPIRDAHIPRGWQDDLRAALAAAPAEERSVTYPDVHPISRSGDPR